MKILLIIALLCVPAHADPAATTPQRCQNALSACINLVKVQDEAVVHLKEAVTKLEDVAVKGSEPSILPWWGWVLAGAAGGILTHQAIGK